MRNEQMWCMFFAMNMQGILSQPGMKLDLDGETIGINRIKLAANLADTMLLETEKRFPSK